MKRDMIIHSKTMVNYANGKVYRLVNNVDEMFYVGSTCNPFHKRKKWAQKEMQKGLPNNQCTSTSMELDGRTLKLS